MIDKDFPASDYQQFVGKTVKELINDPEADEGLKIIFTDDSWLCIGFSSCEGEIDKSGS